MRLLLDTHVFLWWLSDDARLLPETRAVIADGSNDVLISAVSFAEIAIKRSVGKLQAPSDLFAALAEEGFDELPLLARHAALLGDLPFHHRDPFDRMLVAQSLAEGVPLVTYDDRLRLYPVTIATR